MGIFTDDHNDIRDLLLTEGAPYHWRARYSQTTAATYGLASAAVDLHLPTGVARCPTCYNLTLQRSASTLCPTCYGTGWTGGFASLQVVQALVVYGTHQLAQTEAGILLSVAGWWCYSLAEDVLLLPEDLLAPVEQPGVRYLVGELGNTPGVAGAPAVRINQVFPQAPDSPWQAVPL